MVSNHGNLQNTLLLALGYRALRGLPRCTAQGGINTGDGIGNGEDNGEGRPAGMASGSGGKRGEAGARGGTGNTWGPLVGYVQPYQEAYVWEGAD